MRPLNSCPAGRGVAGGQDFNQRDAALSAVTLRGRTDAPRDTARRGSGDLEVCGSSTPQEAIGQQR